MNKDKVAAKMWGTRASKYAHLKRENFEKEMPKSRYRDPYLTKSLKMGIFLRTIAQIQD